MKRVTVPLKNQEGSAIVIALLALAVLTIIGIASTNTSVIENQIVRNEQIYQNNFYQAEAAAMEAAQVIVAETDIDRLRLGSGKEDDMLTATEIDLWSFTPSDVQSLISGLSGGTEGASAVNAVVANDAYYAANAEGIVAGASLDMTTDNNVYGFKIYGFSKEQNGNALISIGLKRRM